MIPVVQQRGQLRQKPNHPLQQQAPGMVDASEAEKSSIDSQADAISWKSELAAAFRVNPSGNACVVAALIIGFFHGWLKRSFPGVVSVFAYDIPLTIGLALAWSSVPKGKSLFPSSHVSTALKVVIAIVLFYTLIPTDVPWLIRLASVRGWIFIPLMFLVGYHILRTPAQMKWVGRLILILCILTTIYGMRQDPAELLKAAVEDEGYKRTVSGVTYKMSEGVGGFRVFSTFVGAGMFAAALGFGIIVGLAEATESEKDLTTRLTFALAAAVSLYGVFISGSRSGVLVSFLSAVIVACLRGQMIRLMLVIGSLGAVGFVIVDSYKLVDSSRILSSFSMINIISRSHIVVIPTIERLLEAPLGRGIGYSTHGVPVILENLVTRYYVPSQIDGDIGHAAVDFGIFGMVAYCAMMFRAVQDCLVWTRAQQANETKTLGIVSGTFSIIAIFGFVTGSPFIHVPGGAIIWFYIGGLNRCYDNLGRVENPGKQASLRVTPAGSGGAPSPRSVVTSNSPQVKPAQVKTAKPRRFLYG